MTAESGARRIVIDAVPGPGQHHWKWLERKRCPLGRRCQLLHGADTSILGRYLWPAASACSGAARCR